MKIAIIGTYDPRACGIATFTKDLFKSLQLIPEAEPAIIAISNGSEKYFPEEVVAVIRQYNREDYSKIAVYLNTHFDVCILQHEYGIFGGEDGEFILELSKALHIPLVSNLHTILSEPSKGQKRIIQELANISQYLTVMTSTAIDILHTVYESRLHKIKLIPHGVPNFQYDQHSAKQKLQLAGKKIALSFGFLGKNKGYETALKAISLVKDPDFCYIILGCTHPNVVTTEGERYRESLEKMVMDLNIVDSVLFINEFADESLLIDYLQATDIYISPYPHEGQISSGTLTFAVGAGAAVVSTPYIYAKDLLANHRGLLFDFNQADQLALIINNLLEQPEKLSYYRNKAKEYGKTIHWKNIGKIQFELLSKTCHKKTIQLYYNNPVQYKPTNMA